MTAIIYSFFRMTRRLGLLSLATFLPALLYAQPPADNQPVKALTTSASGALVVLRDNGLVVIESGVSTPIQLPTTSEEARPSSLTKGADGNVYLAGLGLGVWRYNSAGNRWQSLNDTLPDLGVTAIAAHATQPDTLYAYYPDLGMFRSRDGGAEWVNVDNGPQEPVQAFLHSDMPGSMESGWLFAGTTRGVSRSMDCFCFWGDAGDLQGKVSAISYDPAAPENVYAVVDGAVYHSADGGEAWAPLKVIVPETVTALVFSQTQGLVVGTADGKLLALNGTNEWTRVND
ncbi:MAG: hypothetical protein WED11_07660 [Natronospirillum sp.]